jgi:transposase
MCAEESKKGYLADAYRFDGFHPLAGKGRGIFGKPQAQLIALGRRSKKTCCGECGAVQHGWHNSESKLVRDLSCGDMQIYLEIQFRHLFCQTCGKVTSEGLEWLADNGLYTKRFANYVQERCHYESVESVATDLDLDPDTVKQMKKNCRRD